MSDMDIVQDEQSSVKVESDVEMTIHIPVKVTAVGTSKLYLIYKVTYIYIDAEDSDCSDEVVILPQTGKCKKVHDSSMDETPPTKKQKLGKGATQNTPVPKTAKSLSNSAPTRQHADSRRTSMSSTKIAASKEGTSCLNCSSRKAVSHVWHVVEPEEDTKCWDEFFGNKSNQKQFLNPWDPTYEPLFIFL
ncbi:hypothetical protein CPB84DRAFT_1856785 [Gymnopilus junonius]|uniref:Uncharacterized protein n=1 Tax=Gymnopilus junonius TaxID=109634 RepID=A0A9P5TEH8_GYMJU|nr:hypothetical protein CPB84DRAFT_1856785 [Gymnopilus junonius]